MHPPRARREKACKMDTQAVDDTPRACRKKPFLVYLKIPKIRDMERRAALTHLQSRGKIVSDKKTY